MSPLLLDDADIECDHCWQVYEMRHCKVVLASTNVTDCRVLCWADNRPNTSQPCNVVTDDPIGLCPRHRRELVPTDG